MGCVVTAKTQYSLKNAKGYFEEHLSVGDYYDEGEKTRGQWFGQGAEFLGLTGRIEAKDFLSLCENRRPDSGERLTQRLTPSRRERGRTVSNRRIFYDFTFSPPKSVSIMALLADDKRVIEAHQRALGVALREFEPFGSTRIRRRDANGNRVTGNIVAALFTHDSSRALDPHLHTHCIVFNATFDKDENQWKALQNYEMLRARKYTEAVYYHELAKDLRRFGYAIRNHPRGDFQVEGVSEELRDRFSKRHEQINEAVAHLLAEKPELARGNLKDLRESLATAERSRKMHNLTRADLRVLWNAQISSVERETLGSLVRAHGAAQNESVETVVSEAVAWAEEHLFDRRSVVLEHEIWLCALERARGEPFELTTLQGITQRRGYVRDPKDRLQVTTRPVLQREWEIVATAANGIGQFRSLVHESEAGGMNASLDDEQRSALSQLLRSRNFITIFRGGAGTGKSHVLRELATQLQTNAQTLVVLAPQRQQVVDLETSGFPSPTTVASFVIQKPRLRSPVVILDEAGQVGARHMLELMRFVASAEGRLILSGDTRQHGPVEASDALLAIERYAGVKPVELETIRRQDPKVGRTLGERASIAEYRRAVNAAAAGRLQESFDRLNKLGAILSCRVDEQQAKLAEEYVRLTEMGFSTVVVSQTWSEVRRVNEAVRAALKARGLIGSDEQAVGALEKVDLTSAQKRDARFYGGDSVVVLNQAVRGAPAGATARCVAVLRDGVLIEANDCLVTVPTRHLDRITVCQLVELKLARGDRLQLKANRKQMDGRSVTNGELVTIRSLRSDGTIELEDGRVLDTGYREFVPGYAVTSYGSQGKTVDYVLFSDSAVRAATNDQQWYVTISRGRRGIRIFTPDKPQLRENVIRSGQRKLALEVAVPKFSLVSGQRTARHGMCRWFRRFGQRASELMLAARRFHRFNDNRREKNEHQTSRVLVP